MNILLDLFKSNYKNWSFSYAMAMRELKSSTSGSILGLGWIVLRPFIQIFAYIFVVLIVFRTKLGNSSSEYDYVLYVLSGMFSWQILQRCLEDSPSLIRERIEILKQVVYPIETLPITAFIKTFIGPAFILISYLIVGFIAGKLQITILLIPLPLILVALLSLGISWFLMVLGVVIKDLREIIAVILGLLVYISPVFLDESMVSNKVWNIVKLNPFTHVIIAFRDIFVGDFHMLSWVIFFLITIVALFGGAFAIHRAKVSINEYI